MYISDRNAILPPKENFHILARQLLTRQLVARLFLWTVVTTPTQLQPQHNLT